MALLSPSRPSDLISGLSSLGDELEVSIVSIPLLVIASGAEDPKRSVSVKNLTRGVLPPLEEVGLSELEADDGRFSLRDCLPAIVKTWSFGPRGMKSVSQFPWPQALYRRENYHSSERFASTIAQRSTGAFCGGSENRYATLRLTYAGRASRDTLSDRGFGTAGRAKSDGDVTVEAGKKVRLASLVICLQHFVLHSRAASCPRLIQHVDLDLKPIAIAQKPRDF